MPVRVNINKQWSTRQLADLQSGLLDMVTDIHRKAVILAPVMTSALRNSGRVEPILGGYAVRFGNARVPYARRRHFENNKNPNTKGYLAKAGDSVARGDKSKYFKDVL
jgi:hypothetical protein